MRQEIQDVFRKYGVQLFTFTQEDLFTYSLKTADPVPTTLIDDLKEALMGVVEIKVDRLNMQSIDLNLYRLPPDETMEEKINQSAERKLGASPALGEGYDKDAVNHPSHYASGKIEVIEAIEDWKLGFNRGNAVKYLARAGKKDPTKEVEDLKKAVWYVNREIELISAKTELREKVRPNDMVKEKKLPPEESKWSLACKNCNHPYGRHIKDSDGCPQISLLSAPTKFELLK